MKITCWRMRALTLIELLVVIAIAGMLLAITLVAVQRSRETSRRLSCANNLKQLGIAMHSYQALHGVFPSNGIGEHSYGYSVFARLLPHLELVEVYNAINFSARQYYESDPTLAPEITNMTAQSQIVQLFLCPSDPNRTIGRFGLTDRPIGGTNYRANGGIRLYPTWNEPWDWSRKGAFQEAMWLGPRDFTDGLAATAGFSERVRGDDDPRVFLKTADMWYLGGLSPPPGVDMAEACSAPFPSSRPPHNSLNGYSWLLAGKLDTWYEHVVTPNHPASDCSPFGEFDHYSHLLGIVTARSYHPNGVNCLMMDGTVRFVTASISRDVWHAIGTRAKGETVDSQTF